jgi:hypothetical protein
MTVVFRKGSQLVPSGLSRLMLFVSILVIAMAGQARAADGTVQVWQGQYKSNALQKMVSVRLRFDASPVELRFEPMGCRVGLTPVSKESSAVYSVDRYKEDEMSGPYCGIWVGGLIELRLVGDDQSMLTMKLVNKSGKSQVDATLRPDSGIR